MPHDITTPTRDRFEGIGLASTVPLSEGGPINRVPLPAAGAPGGSQPAAGPPPVLPPAAGPIAQPGPAQAAVGGPIAPQQAQQPPVFGNNAFEVVGRLLSNFARRAQGKEARFTRENLDAKAREREAFEIKKASAALGIMDRILKAPLAVQNDLVTQIHARVPSLGIKSMLANLGRGTQPAEIMSLVKDLSSEGRFLFMQDMQQHGAPAALLRLDETRTTSDALAVTRIQAKLDTIVRTAEQLSPGIAEKMENNNLSLAQLSQQDQKYSLFEQGDMGVIRRDCAAGRNNFASFGIVCPVEVTGTKGLHFTNVKAEGKTFIVGLNPATGEEMSRIEIPTGAGAGGGTALKSDLIDAQGNLKDEVANSLVRQINFFLGGNELASANQEFLELASVRGTEALLAERSKPLDKRLVVSTTQAASIGIAKALEERPEFRDTIALTPKLKLEKEEAIRLGFKTMTRINQVLLTDMTQAIGPQSNVQAVINFVTGTAGSLVGADTLSFPRTEDARAALQLLAIDLRAALVLNPRFPVKEVENLGRIIPSAEQFFTAPQVAVAKLRAIYQKLTMDRAFDAQVLGQSVTAPTSSDALRTMTLDQLKRTNIENLTEEESALFVERWRELGGAQQ